MNVTLRGREKSKPLMAVVDTGFMGDLITRPEVLRELDLSFKWERIRTIANGERVKVTYGLGSAEIMGEVTSVDVEVWDELKLPASADALLGVTALEKLGLKVDPKTGKLEKAELYLL